MWLKNKWMWEELKQIFYVKKYPTIIYLWIFSRKLKVSINNEKKNIF